MITFSAPVSERSLCCCVFFDGFMAVCYLFILRAYCISEWETSGGRSSWLVAYSTAASGVPWCDASMFLMRTFARASCSVMSCIIIGLCSS